MGRGEVPGSEGVVGWSHAVRHGGAMRRGRVGSGHHGVAGGRGGGGRGWMGGRGGGGHVGWRRAIGGGVGSERHRAKAVVMHGVGRQWAWSWVVAHGRVGREGGPGPHSGAIKAASAPVIPGPVAPGGWVWTPGAWHRGHDGWGGGTAVVGGGAGGEVLAAAPSVVHWRRLRVAVVHRRSITRGRGLIVVGGPKVFHWPGGKVTPALSGARVRLLGQMLGAKVCEGWSWAGARRLVKVGLVQAPGRAVGGVGHGARGQPGLQGRSMLTQEAGGPIAPPPSALPPHPTLTEALSRLRRFSSLRVRGMAGTAEEGEGLGLSLLLLLTGATLSRLHRETAPPSHTHPHPHCHTPTLTFTHPPPLSLSHTHPHLHTPTPIFTHPPSLSHTHPHLHTPTLTITHPPSQKP